jgi:hypothetical protein
MAAFPFYNSAGIANNRTIGWHIPVDDNGSGPDLTVFADIDRTEQGGIGADQDMIANGRVPFILVMTRAAEGNPMKKYTVITDFGRFSDDNSGAMIDKEAPSNAGSWMNFNARPEPVQNGYHARDNRYFQLSVQKMSKSVDDDGMQGYMT